MCIYLSSVAEKVLTKRENMLMCILILTVTISLLFVVVTEAIKVEKESNDRIYPVRG